MSDSLQEQDPFLRSSINSRALEYLLNGVLDEGRSLYEMSSLLPKEDFMQVLGNEDGASVAFLARRRAEDVLDDLLVMESLV